MLIPLEYALALLTLALLIPLIVAAKRVAVVHTANPPDFIIPAVAWLKMFGIKLVYDVHDVSGRPCAESSPTPGWPSRCSPSRSAGWSASALLGPIW